MQSFQLISIFEKYLYCVDSLSGIKYAVISVNRYFRKIFIMPRLAKWQNMQSFQLISIFEKYL